MYSNLVELLFFTAYEFDIMPKNQLVTAENALKMVVLQ